MNHSRQFPLNVQLPYVQERNLGSLSQWLKLLQFAADDKAKK